MPTEGIDPKYLIFLADNNGPLTLEELKTYITPSQNELKQSREGLDDDDPATPLEEQKAAIDALPAGFTFEGLENCLPEKGHAALLTVRRAGTTQEKCGDAGGALYWIKPDAEKPDYEGERERARKNTSKRPECANKPTHTGRPVGLSITVPIKSKQYNVEVNAVYPNCDIYNYYPVQRLAGTKHPVAAVAAQQAAPKKAKTAPEVKPLKWCAHMAINGACAFYDCPLEMMVDDVEDVGGKGAVCQVNAIDHSPAKKVDEPFPFDKVMDGAIQRETTHETTEEWKPPEGGTKTTNAREHTTMQIWKRTFDGRLEA
eukprot:g33522.t1